MDVRIEESWKEQLKNEFEKPYFVSITEFIKSELALGKKIFPPAKLIFNAFDKTPFSKVKVVILGQDPYHGEGQAHGLCFSVNKGVRTPPSLVNIYKELQSDLGIPPASHGCLEKWTDQGVFLLNAVLTVEASKPTSHSKIGWETFTNAVISKISENKEGVVFMLWGNFARAKKQLIDTSKHFVLESAHPSPFSAHNFLGCRHFSKANELLAKQGLDPIDWSVD